MADRQSDPPDIQSVAPKGINLRVDKNALPSGFCDREHGMWPKRTGSRSRLLGKTLYRQVGDDVNQIHQTFGGPGILMQIGNTLQYETLDTLLGIASSSSLTASVGNEEDQVAMALITQTESNTTHGGSIDGFLSGSSTATADTFYGRRLTNMWVNETVSGLQAVNTFTASTGGAGSASTAGQFVLVPGTYRVFIWCRFEHTFVGANALFGLYNATTSLFETYSGTSEPIVSTPTGPTSGSMSHSRHGVIVASITVTSSNKTFEIRQKGSDASDIQAVTFCGSATGMTGANVNAAAAKNVYTTVKIWRFT